MEFKTDFIYGFAITESRYIIFVPIVTKGKMYIRWKDWCNYSIWDKIKAFFFGEIELIEIVYK